MTNPIQKTSLSVAEFRAKFRELKEPTEVMRYGKRVGTWYPEGTEIPETVTPVVSASWTARPFTPAPKPEKRPPRSRKQAKK